MDDSLLVSAEHIVFGYTSDPVLRDAGLALASGDLVALLGPNGSGKTTLVKLLCGIIKPQRGRIRWEGKDTASVGRRSLARRLALVPQELNVPFAFTVSEIVGLGRTPHLRALSGESMRDRAAVERALQLTETDGLKDRFFGEISGGEQQRAVIAMALAQIGLPPSAGETNGIPKALLLDEPTVHLDINHQIQVLELIRRLNREYGLTILATMHDLNLASLYFDRLILLNEGRIVTEGSPADVLSEERMQNVFHANVLIQPHPTRTSVPNIILLPNHGNGHN